MKKKKHKKTVYLSVFCSAARRCRRSRLSVSLNKTAIIQCDRSNREPSFGWVINFVCVCLLLLFPLFSFAFAQFSCKCIYKAKKRCCFLSYVMRFKRRAALCVCDHCMPTIGIKTSPTTGNSINFHTLTYFFGKNQRSLKAIMLVPINLTNIE